MSPKYIGKGLLVPVGDLTPEQLDWLNRRFEPHQHGAAGETRNEAIAKLKRAHADAMREWQQPSEDEETMPASNRQARESEVWEVASLFDRSHWPNVPSVRGPESA